MAISSVVKTLRDGTVKLTSGNPFNLSLTYDIGDFTVELQKSDRIVIRSRNDIVGLRAGPSPVLGFSFSVNFREFTNGGADTVLDFINKTGAGSANTSTGGAGYEQYLLDVTYTADATALGDATAAACALSKCLLFASFSEGDPSSLAITGECYGGATFTGIA